MLADPVRIVVDSPSARLREVAEFLAQVLESRTGFTVVIAEVPGAGSVIALDERGDVSGDEAYRLAVAPGAVRISASTAAGAFWGVQTLRQLLPPEFENLRGARPASWELPAVRIEDSPRFRWRGSLMDVSRHFFPVEFVERYIDLLSRYKMNVLHWHLTDDQGWRLEIRRYSRLTGVGAWRREADGSRYGGYYTQDDVRRIVEYARRRNVTIVPEIEMPGHSQAAVAAYPDLGCTGDSVGVATTWGVKKEILCAGKDGTFDFIEDVLDEVVSLFPSEYIHIGGDEVPKDRWKDCAPCQAVIEREGLGDESGLQRWFIGRVQAMLRERGRQLIGWDEILEGGLVPGATVQVWRDTAHATAAVRLGSHVVVSPTSHAYLDASPNDLPLERVYGFEPVPSALTPDESAMVLGGEGNLWSEYITTANFDLMAFPRILAMAEVLWSEGTRRYDDFLDRLRAGHYPRLRAIGVRAGPEDRHILRLTTTYDSIARGARVMVERGIDSIAIRHDIGAPPRATSPVYADGALLRGPGTIVLQPFIGSAALPIQRTITVIEHRARDAEVRLTRNPSPRYPGTGRWTLVDGLLGSTDLHDGLWQGWLGRDLEATIDLGAPTPIRSIAASFLQATPSWVLMPVSLTCEHSLDAVHWAPAGRTTHDISPRLDDPQRVELECRLGIAIRARHIRVVARNFGPLPSWHPGAGKPSWIFADEIVVR